MTTDVWLIILGGAIGTYLCRFSFIAFGERADHVPEAVRRSLRYIPPAALAALAAPAILRPGGIIDPLGPTTLAGLVATVVAFTTRSVPWTIGIGIAVLAVLQQVLPS